MLAHLLLSALFAVSLGQSVQHVLDLTRREDVTPTPQGVTGGGSGCARGDSSGIGPKSADVIVTLLPLPQPEYFVGGHIVFDVIIKNAGAGPVEFPWNQWVISLSPTPSRWSRRDSASRPWTTQAGHCRLPPSSCKETANVRDRSGLSNRVRACVFAFPDG